MQIVLTARARRLGFCIVRVTWACGVVFGGAAWGQGSQFGLRFYGTGTGQQDRVRIQIDDDAPGPDASAPCDMGNGSFTLDWWMRGRLIDNGSGNSGGDVSSGGNWWIDGNVIIDRDIFGGSDADWGISIAGGFVRFGTGPGEPFVSGEYTIEGNVNVLDNAWHHVAVVRDAATGRLQVYVDGALDFQSPAGVSTGNVSYPNGGVPGQATQWGPYIVLAAEKHDAGPAYPSYNGYMDELRIWNVARSQAQIIADMGQVISPSSTGLVAYYRFEETSGTAILDSSAAGSPTGLLIANSPGNGERVSYASNPNNTAPISGGSLPPGFQRTTLVDTLDEPVVLELAPDGRLFVGERDGTIWIYQAGAMLPTPLIQINTETSGGERGLVGLAVDPNFASNGYLYAYYTTTEPRNRVGRFAVVGNTANPASEFLVWQNPDIAADFHHGGSLGFGPDGNLYISTGDQFGGAVSLDLGNEHGKILRVTPTGGIPPTNPFVGVPGARPAIWARGLRNPFRFTFDSLTGNLFIGDVGGNNFDSWEEINLGMSGASYGWPEQEGPLCYVSDCSAYTFPEWTYQHNDPNYFVNVNQASITCGPVYRAMQFPATYQGNLFVGDYANRWIRRLVFDGGGNVIADPLFLAAPDAGTIADLAIGPEGAIYYVTVGIPWSGAPDLGALHRISYIGTGNQPPVVFASANPTSGPSPLSVQFGSAGTFDPDSGPSALTYSWTFGDGSPGSTLPNPQHLYSTPGMYAARLTVSDGAAMTQSNTLGITVGNPPVATITMPSAGTQYRAGYTINFAGSAMDTEDGTLPASAFSWSVVLRHSDHTHPFLGPINGVTSGSFMIPASGHTPENTFYEIQLTVTDSDNLQDSASRDLVPVISTIVFDTDPPGIPIFLDTEAINTPRVYNSVSGHQHMVEAQQTFSLGGTLHAFQCWSDGGARIHTYTAPEGGGALTAIYAPPTGQQSITVAVASEDRDADYFPGSPNFGERLANGYDSDNLCTGRESGGDWQSGVQFALSIPQGALVLSATLEMTATYDNAGSPIAAIRAFNVGNAAPFSNAHTHRLDQHQAVTAASVNWVFSGWTQGQTYTSPDLTSLVQAVVNRADWAAGNFLGLVLDGSASPVGTWRCFRNSPTGDAAELSVTFTVEGGGPTGCCEPPCDDGLFCNGLEMCVNGACEPGTYPCPITHICVESTDQCVGCVNNNGCTDGVLCTMDVCVNGFCMSTPNDALCPSDGLFCNGAESCNAALGCVSSGNPCGMLACDEMIDQCVGCSLDTDCSDGNPCTTDFCDNGICQTEGPGSCPPLEACRNDPANTACNCVSCGPTCLCEYTPIAFGDVNCDPNQLMNLDDILCVLSGFANFANCVNGDIAPCDANGIINLDDILGVLAAFGGADPCACD